MGIVLASNFDVNIQSPIDSRMSVVDDVARDAIVAGVRWEGMMVYNLDDGKTYQLVGGITNSDWQEVGTGGGGGGGVPTDIGAQAFAANGAIVVAGTFSELLIIQPSAQDLSLSLPQGTLRNQTVFIYCAGSGGSFTVTGVTGNGTQFFTQNQCKQYIWIEDALVWAQVGGF